MDPISAKMTKMTVENNLPRQQANLNYQVERSSFGDLLTKNIDSGQTTTNQMLEFVDGIVGGTSAQPLNAIPANEIKVDMAKVKEVDSNGSGFANPILNMFQEINRGQNQMEGLLEQVSTKGKKFSTFELIRMQMFTHQHAMGLELFTQFAASGNRSIQSVMNMQM